MSNHLILLILFLIVSMCHALIEMGYLLNNRNEYTKLQRVPSEFNHRVVVAVFKKNLDIIEKETLDRANPESILYQQWLSYDEINSLVINEESYQAVVDWLKNYNVKIVHVTPRKDYITLESSISNIEELFHTEFFVWKNFENPHQIVYAANNYYVPPSMQRHIFNVFNVSDLPPRITHHISRPKSSNSFKSYLRLKSQVRGDSSVTISLLNSMYQVPNNNASNFNHTYQQSVFETSNQYYSPSDLLSFQGQFGLEIREAIDIGGQSSNFCGNTSINCDEGNLDLQYLMGMAQNVATIYWYVSSGNAYLQWILDVAGTSKPPMVNSISWGSIEQDMDTATLTSFSNEAMLLAAQGVTILVSSGDNGAANYDYTSRTCMCNQDSSSSQLKWSKSSGGSTVNWSGRGYFPSFPASCPWITSVGATSGLNAGNPEVACQSDSGNVITTGGGFSTFFDRPSWQNEAVNLYFNQTSVSPILKNGGFNIYGRGYPDISLIGVEYEVVIRGSINSVYGTSCSSPVFAGFVSLVNALRSHKKLSPIGFLNPTLYFAGANKTHQFFNDVVSGNNKCCANSDYQNVATTCCVSGFTASTGWDPLTGWGSVYFTEFALMHKIDVDYIPISTPAPSFSLFGLSLQYIIAIVVIVVVGILVCFFLSRLCSYMSKKKSPSGISPRNMNRNNGSYLPPSIANDSSLAPIVPGTSISPRRTL